MSSPPIASPSVSLRPADDGPAPLPPPARLEQIRTGAVKLLGYSGIRTAIDKAAIDGTHFIGPHGLDGDAHAESFHGGSEKAILQYDSDHYAKWRQEFPDAAERFVPGGFGENFVAAGINETNVCIGDIFRVGAALIQVSEARQPCFKLNHRFGQPNVSRRAQATGRTGWLYRVIAPGAVTVGDAIELQQRPHPAWSVSRVQHFLYDEIGNRDAARILSELPLLSPGFRALFARRLETAAVEDWESRLSNGPLAKAPVAWIEADIAAIADVTPTVKLFQLTRADGTSLPRFEPGAHIDLKVENSVTRSYSLLGRDYVGNTAGGEAGDGYWIAVKRVPEGRGGSRYLHDAAKIGERLTITAPKNFFQLTAAAGRQRLIAGGIGITPFLSMIGHLEADGADWELHYCVRSREDAAFADRLAARYPRRVCLHVSNGDRRHRLDVAALLADARAGDHVYCCGPAGLMNEVHAATREWPEGHVHFESFAGRAAPGTADCSADCSAFTVTARGRDIEVGAGATLLEALRGAGFELPSSCEAGTCGTCCIKYVAGNVDHRDMVLTANERRDHLIPCVSRASGRLVLEL